MNIECDGSSGSPDHSLVSAGRAQRWQQRGWAQALVPPGCLSPSPACPHLPAATYPTPSLTAPLNPCSPSSFAKPHPAPADGSG